MTSRTSENPPGKFGFQPRNHQYRPRDSPYKPRDSNYHRKDYQQSRDKWYKDTCKSCGLTDRELFKFCKKNHKDTYFLKGPDFIKDKEIRD